MNLDGGLNDVYQRCGLGSYHFGLSQENKEISSHI